MSDLTAQQYLAVFGNVRSIGRTAQVLKVESLALWRVIENVAELADAARALTSFFTDMDRVARYALLLDEQGAPTTAGWTPPPGFQFDTRLFIAASDAKNAVDELWRAVDLMNQGLHANVPGALAWQVGSHVDRASKAATFVAQSVGVLLYSWEVQAIAELDGALAELPGDLTALYPYFQTAAGPYLHSRIPRQLEVEGSRLYMDWSSEGQPGGYGYWLWDKPLGAPKSEVFGPSAFPIQLPHGYFPANVAARFVAAAPAGGGVNDRRESVTFFESSHEGDGWDHCFATHFTTIYPQAVGGAKPDFAEINAPPLQGAWDDVIIPHPVRYVARYDHGRCSLRIPWTCVFGELKKMIGKALEKRLADVPIPRSWIQTSFRSEMAQPHFRGAPDGEPEWGIYYALHVQVWVPTVVSYDVHVRVAYRLGRDGSGFPRLTPDRHQERIAIPDPSRPTVEYKNVGFERAPFVPTVNVTATRDDVSIHVRKTSYAAEDAAFWGTVGAALGSVVPGVGTAIGAVAGAALAGAGAVAAPSEEEIVADLNRYLGFEPTKNQATSRYCWSGTQCQNVPSGQIPTPVFELDRASFHAGYPTLESTTVPTGTTELPWCSAKERDDQVCVAWATHRLMTDIFGFVYPDDADYATTKNPDTGLTRADTSLFHSLFNKTPAISRINILPREVEFVLGDASPFAGNPLFERLFCGRRDNVTSTDVIATLLEGAEAKDLPCYSIHTDLESAARADRPCCEALDVLRGLAPNTQPLYTLGVIGECLSGERPW